jgi:hypothetical protein
VILKVLLEGIVPMANPKPSTLAKIPELQEKDHRHKDSEMRRRPENRYSRMRLPD